MQKCPYLQTTTKKKDKKEVIYLSFPGQDILGDFHEKHPKKDLTLIKKNWVDVTPPHQNFFFAIALKIWEFFRYFNLVLMAGGLYRPITDR